MEEKASKSVRFNSDTDLKFSKLSEKLGRSKQEMFGQMVDYFYKSKKDPADLNDELLKKELGQGINRIISFIKTQEKEALTPILSDQGELKRALATLHQQVDSFFRLDEDGYAEGLYLDTQEIRHKEAKAIGEQQATFYKQQQTMAQTLQNLLSETQTYQSGVKTHREGKNALKAKFRDILDSYMQQRDALNTLTQGRAVKDLQESARSQVENL
jgi:cytochrome c556